MDKSFIIGTISIGVALFAIWASTDNVWNSPNFDIKVNTIQKNEEGKKPVDEIVRVIYDERNLSSLTAEWIRDREPESLRELKERFSPEDAWVLDRIYYNPEIDGLSQKIIIKNDGNSQAHDVIIQILGDDNFKIIDYSCPEIMSDEQIIKEFGKKYIVSKSRMSVKLECEITINSVGTDGVKQVIVTAEESHPRIWPDDLINNLRTQSIILNIILYLVIGILAIIVSYNVTKIYEKKMKQKSKSAV